MRSHPDLNRQGLKGEQMLYGTILPEGPGAKSEMVHSMWVWSLWLSAILMHKLIRRAAQVLHESACQSSQSPHRPFEAINATPARHPTHTMLVKQICQLVILIICQVHRAARRYASSHSMFCTTTIAAAAALRTTSDGASLSAATMVCFNAVVPLRRLQRASTARTWRVQ